MSASRDVSFGVSDKLAIAAMTSVKLREFPENRGGGVGTDRC